MSTQPSKFHSDAAPALALHTRQQRPPAPPAAPPAASPALALGLVMLSSLALGLGGCATPPMPTDQIAVTTAAIAHAEAAGGQSLAPAEMGMARDKLRRANLAVTANAPTEARRLAQQAQVDALLAEAKTESSKAQKAADEVAAASRALREEMGRKAP